jgi:hypothetical protein
LPETVNPNGTYNLVAPAVAANAGIEARAAVAVTADARTRVRRFSFMGCVLSTKTTLAGWKKKGVKEPSRKRGEI